MKRDLQYLPLPKPRDGIPLAPRGEFTARLTRSRKDKPPTKMCGIKFLANDCRDLVFCPETLPVNFCDEMTDEIVNVLDSNIKDVRIGSYQDLETVLRRIELESQIVATRVGDEGQLQPLCAKVRWLPRTAERKRGSLNMAYKRSSLKFYIRTRVLQVSRIAAKLRMELNDDRSLKDDIFSEQSRITVARTIKSVVRGSFWAQYLDYCD